MEESLVLVAVMLCILAAAGISKRILGTILTLPMVYVALGFLLSERVLGIVAVGPENELVRVITELTLVLVLASDASRIDPRMLLRDHSLPQRLLGIGLPLTMLFGTLIAYVMFGTLGLWGAAILGVLLSPTDASLGLAVVTNPRVPVRIRQALNIESGLNDGIAMPFLLLAISMAVATEQVAIGIGSFLGQVLAQILLGCLAGVVVGALGTLFIELGHKRGWMSSEFQKISGIALALLAYGVAELVGGNGFVAAFAFGATVGNWRKSEISKVLHEHVEVEVELLILLTFLIFGAVLLPPALERVDGTVALYAIISLTVVRMVPAAIGLIGSKVRPITSLFLGWFGPRGVASILYIFTILDTEALEGKELIYAVTMITVLFSIFAHGVTAAPLANWYGKRVAEAEEPDSAEQQEVPEMPLRAYPASRRGGGNEGE
ncbi:cation:proton antiporter [Chloroflexota bacterium]